MKFQVLKQGQRSGFGEGGKPWTMDIVKGLFTDDEGEIEMMEVVSFPRDGQPTVQYTPGETCTPVIGVRRDRKTQRPEVYISSLKRASVAAAPVATPKAA